jgi:hypothetical protein
MRSIAGVLLTVALATLTGCQAAPEPKWGTEAQQSLPGAKRQVWAVAPAVNLSGQRGVDPLLQADLAYQQLQQVDGVTVIPVNRVAEVYASLRIEQVQSREQAAIVCDLLGADALLVPTVTAYDPYNPPKLGASLHLFGKPAGYGRPDNVDPRALSRAARPKPSESAPPLPAAGFLQVVGMFDAANGTVRDALDRYAAGRSDPIGAYGRNEYLVDMDRYGAFVYHELIAELLKHPRLVKQTKG